MDQSCILLHHVLLLWCQGLIEFHSLSPLSRPTLRTEELLA